MLFCITGPSGCGKSTVVEELNKLGYKSADSYTTRPKRYANEGGHTFITQEQFDKLVDKVAYTHFNGYDYCVTREMLDGCDFYIIDPAGIQTLKDSGYDKFKVIGLQLTENDRAKRMNARGDSEKAINDRLSNDREAYNNFESICDIMIDATKEVQEIVNLIVDYINMNK